MKIVLLTPWISPHELPLAERLARKLTGRDFCYLHLHPSPPNHRLWGWEKLGKQPWCRMTDIHDSALYETELLISGLRLPDLFSERADRHLRTYYVSERWFKPTLGFLRLLSPSYFLRAWRMMRGFISGRGLLLPQGIHAARDFARLMGLFSGDIRCFFRSPKVAFESCPGGVIVPLKQAIATGVLDADAVAFAKRHGFVQISREHWGKVKPTGRYAKMRLWGYFVAPGQGKPAARADGPLRILWVGRMLDWKRVSTLVVAVKSLSNVTLDLYGRGPAEGRLKQLAEECEAIRFHDYVPVEEVRNLMRAHDVYVLSSDGGEGWGAVVSEALEEGMTVIGTAEAGASATILPPECLYPAGDVVALRRLLETLRLKSGGIGPWTAEYAAESLLKLSEE